MACLASRRRRKEVGPSNLWLFAKWSYYSLRQHLYRRGGSACNAVVFPPLHSFSPADYLRGRGGPFLKLFSRQYFSPSVTNTFFLFSPLFSYFFRSRKTSSEPPLRSDASLKQKFPRVYGRKQSNLFASPPFPLNPFSGLVFLSSIPFWGFLVLFPIEHKERFWGFTAIQKRHVAN